MTNRVISFRLVVAAFFLMYASATASAQLLYDGTVFLHGFSSGPSTWDGTPGWLSDRLYTKVMKTPKTDSSATINMQRNELRTLLSGYGGNQVLVGHSMGGLVARATYVENPANISAIVTVGTPHNGALLANNSDQVISWLQGVRDRLVIAVTATLGPSAASEVDSLFTGGYGDVELFAAARFGIGCAAVNDLKTTSTTIASLSSITNDAVPRANVMGHIPFKYALYRLAVPTSEFNKTVNFHKQSLKKLGKCRWLKITIVHFGKGSKCGRARNALRNLDRDWAGLVNGTTTAPWPVGTNPVFEPFDGVVPRSRSLYPGIPFVNGQPNIVASGAHHINLNNSVEGRLGIHQALLIAGVDARPPLNVGIGGINWITSNGTYNWTINVTGADVLPITYKWEWRLKNETIWATVGTNSTSYSKHVLASLPAFYLRATVTSGTRTAVKDLYVHVENSGWCNPPPGQTCPEYVAPEEI